MKNIVLFIILALLTIAALFAWNITKKNNRTPSKVSITTPAPTSSVEGAIRKLFGSKPSATPTPAKPTMTPYPTSSLSGEGTQTTKGGLPVPEEENSPSPVTQQNSTNHVVVQYTDRGFVPSSVSISKGTVITFVNSSSQKMQITSKNSTLSGLNMGTSVSKNGLYDYRFETVGTWEYQNQVMSSHTGTIKVN